MKKRFIALLCLAALLLTACDGKLSEEQAALESYASAIDDIQIPQGVQVVSLGESSHGTKEYHTMRKDVFAHLMEEYGCRTFILEAAFGTCLKVNDYILGKEPDKTAREALQDLEFWVYQTAEFEQLLQWMHDYNQTAPEEQKIHFYGVDMQEGDCAKGYLLSYLRTTAPDKAAEYENLLKPLEGSAYLYAQIERLEEFMQPVSRALDQIAAEMDAQKETYTAISGAYEFAVSRECVNALREYVSLLPLLLADAAKEPELLARGSGLRDSYMANRVETIRQLDGAQVVFLTAHNMHVSRNILVPEGSPKTEPMGEYLSERLGDAYFAIGTAFCKGKITAVHYEQKTMRTFQVEERHPFIRLFADLPGDSWYVDLSRVRADARFAPYLEEAYSFLDTGSVYSRALDSEDNHFAILSPRHPAVLADSWDGMLIFKQSHPTQLLPKGKAE